MASLLSRVGEAISSVATYRNDPFRHLLRESLNYVRTGEPQLTLDHKRIYRAAARFFPAGEQALVLDLGAFDGSWAKMILRVLPSARVICFEPCRSRQAALEALVKVQPRVSLRLLAVGRVSSQLTFRENATGVLSSLKELNPGEYGEIGSEVVSEYPVQVTTLDAETAELRAKQTPLMVKIDVQGAEMEVLEGARETLSQPSCRVVLIELSMREKYKGQATLHVIGETLAELGFVLYDLCPVYRDANGWLTEIDALFVRQSLVQA